jgi:AcrR family transcriptional regulator
MARPMSSTGNQRSVDDQEELLVDEHADLALIAKEVGSGAPQRLLEAGLECFAARGFHGTTTRDIARRAGMSPAAMYVHFASKTELLYLLSRVGHGDALRALVETSDRHRDPPARLWHSIAGFAEWHARHHRLARVAQYELHALPPERGVEIRALRQQFTERLETELRAGISAGAFEIVEAHETVRAILSLCIDIARWYTPHGPRTPDELGMIYADLVLRMVEPRTARVAQVALGIT